MQFQRLDKDWVKSRDITWIGLPRESLKFMRYSPDKYYSRAGNSEK